MIKSFTNRVYGAAIIKSVNSNYNADFSGQPRKLPNGIVYATDKAFKYSIRNYWKNALNQDVFYFKSLNESLVPRDLKESYEVKYSEIKGDKDRITVLENLLKNIDVRLFGGTFAVKKVNLSLHGTCQITHGVNRFGENVIYSEQILSPFRNSNKEDADTSTLGSQSRLEEGHYVHHFTVNPQNIKDMAVMANSDGVTEDDISNLKAAMSKGATFYDSAAKSGTENELLLWVEFKEGAKSVLPSFVDLIEINDNREINLEGVKRLLAEDYISKDVLKIELYFNKTITKVINKPVGAIELAI